jgi:hypothetical protein
MMRLLKDLGCDMNEHKSADTLTSNTALSRSAPTVGVQTTQTKPKKQARPASTAPARKNAKVIRMQSQAASQSQHDSQLADLVPQDALESNIPNYQPFTAQNRVPDQYLPPMTPISTTVYQPFRTSTNPAIPTSTSSASPIRDHERREILQKVSENLARMPPRVETPWARSSAPASMPVATFFPQVPDMPIEQNVQSPPFELIETAIHQSSTLGDFRNLNDDRRHEIIELGIKECLQDDSFVQFCQDLWTMWPRIGLDLKLQANNLH